jgi:hypothetical protein
MEKIIYTEDDVPPLLAQQALDVQSACNASGVIHSFDKIVTALWEMPQAKKIGTAWVNQHPVVTMFLAQLIHLNGAGNSVLPYNHPEAFELCEKVKEVFIK